MIRIIVPGQPIAKGRPKITTIGGRPRAFTPQRTVNYESLIALAGQEAMAGADPIEGAVAVTAFAHFMTPKKTTKAFRASMESGQAWHTGRPDGDNILKALGDGLNGVVWRDDSQIVSAQIIKLYADTPRLVIEVRPMSTVTKA